MYGLSEKEVKLFESGVRKICRFNNGDERVCKFLVVFEIHKSLLIQLGTEKCSTLNVCEFLFCYK